MDDDNFEEFLRLFNTRLDVIKGVYLKKYGHAGGPPEIVFDMLQPDLEATYELQDACYGDDKCLLETMQRHLSKGKPVLVRLDCGGVGRDFFWYLYVPSKYGLRINVITGDGEFASFLYRDLAHHMEGVLTQDVCAGGAALIVTDIRQRQREFASARIIKNWVPASLAAAAAAAASK